MMRLTLIVMALVVPALAAPVLAAEREARACLENRTIRESRFSAEEGYFARSGGTWWQNKARGCALLQPDRSVRTQSPLSRQCSGDQLRVFQNFSGVDFGTCVLGDWEPVEASAVPDAKGRAPAG